MEKIKTIKEIVTNPISGDNVHFIGKVATKKDTSYGSGKRRSAQTSFLIIDGNYSFEGNLTQKNVGKKYDNLVKCAKLEHDAYFEGKVKKSRIDNEVTVEITDINPNVFLKQLEHEEETLEIRLYKCVINGNEDGAIKLIEENKDINVNFEYCDNLLVLSVVQARMYKLFGKIVSHPNFNCSTKDDFGETLFETLLYLYSCDEVQKEENKQEKIDLENMIKAILNVGNYPFNAKDINNDTAITITCNFPNLLWVLDELLKKKEVDVNVTNDLDETPLEAAIRNENIGAIKLLAKRSDLIVRDKVIELAEQYVVDLETLGIDISKTRTDIVNKTAERNKELVEACRG